MKNGKNNLALKQYQKSIDQSRFKVLAQKLAQHLNSLAEDKNTKIRWIWELIQNAKDVPNEFGKVKIKIEVYDDKFVFTHNGDPFRVSDLETLVAQYSSKSEENKTHTQTTGKYGTGFITTYILSRKVRIKGLLKINPKEECVQPENKIQNSEDPDRFVPEEVMVNQDEQKDFLYQRFETLLDRTYRDRDTQLVEKLMKTEQHLMDDLEKNEPKPKWQRTENDYNTHFIYEEIDNSGMEMILPTLNCLKELFPYALLFNPMLSELHLINKSQITKIKNFAIKRMEETDFNGLRIFNAKVTEEKQVSIFSAAYMVDEDTYSTVASPVSLDKGKLKLLETNNNYAKMFKQFPLIGCKDHGFNFVFTSRKFYPNQSRSDLLLNQIDDRPSKKAKQNWNSITGIFEKGLELYIKLSQVISGGQQNLLIVRTSNQFTAPQFINIGIEKLLHKYQQSIGNIDFVEFRNGQRGKLNDLILLQGRSQERNTIFQQYSALLNQKFASIIGSDKTLSDSCYKFFYQKFNKYRQTWSRSQCKYWKIDQCLQKLSKLIFQKIQDIVGKDDVVEYLVEIIQFLMKYHPKTFTKQYQYKYNLLLKNNFELSTYSQNLSFKHQLPLAYEQIATMLEININKSTVHSKFVKYFKLKPFLVSDMKKLYYSKLMVQIMSGKKEETLYENLAAQILKLGKFLSTFKIKSQCMELISQIKGFEQVSKPFAIQDIQTQLTLDPEQINKYRNMFDLKVMRYINDTLDQSDTLKALQKLTVFRDRSQTLEWLNSVFEQQRALLKDQKYKQIESLLPLCLYNLPPQRKKLITKNLSVSEQFRDRDLLKYFQKKGTQEKGDEPDEADIIFLEKMKSLSNRSEPWSLRSNVIHSEIQDTTINPITFEKQYQFVIDMYNNNTISTDKKILILDELYRLRQNAQINKNQMFKLNALKSLEKRAYIDYPNYMRDKTKRQHLETESQQSYVFHFIRNKEQIDVALNLNKQFGSLLNAQAQLKLLKLKLSQFQKK